MREAWVHFVPHIGSRPRYANHAFAGRSIPGDSSARGGFVAGKGLRNNLAGNLQFHQPRGSRVLLQPAYRENFDFVAPLYSRHNERRLVGANLLYPMGRAAWVEGSAK